MQQKNAKEEKMTQNQRFWTSLRISYGRPKTSRRLLNKADFSSIIQDISQFELDAILVQRPIPNSTQDKIGHSS